MGKEPEIVDRTFAFALRVLRLCKKLEEDSGIGRILGKQVLRAGTSIGANVEEGQAAQSRPDFCNKINIALKEARETRYWLRLLKESEIIQTQLLRPLLEECEEISKILAAILRNTRQKPSS